MPLQVPLQPPLGRIVDIPTGVFARSFELTPVVTPNFGCASTVTVNAVPICAVFRSVCGCRASRSQRSCTHAASLPVMSATDLLVSKLSALTEHYCDLSPILAVVRSLREQLDVDLVYRACEGNPFARAVRT